MKNIYRPEVGAFVIFCLFSFFSFNLFAQVGIGTINPNGGSVLDVQSANKGVLLPRVNIANLATLAPITGGQDEGMLVYNTNTTTGPGFFYWNSSSTSGAWKALGGGKSDAQLAFEDATFLDSALFINSNNGNPVAANIYSSSILLTKPTLVEIKVHFDTNITQYDYPNPVITGRPILYSMLLMAGDLATGTPVINDSKSYTSSSAGHHGNTYYGGSFTLGGSGFINLPAGNHTFNMYVLGAGGGSKGFDITYSNTNDARFQIIYHN
ncbi:MAG: hypothetical protein Q8O62_10670 [Aequorivita sp.]|nr:hypothetical protein [Aequorivita sp.]